MALASLLREVGAAISDTERDQMILTALTVYAQGESKDIRAAKLLLPKLSSPRYRTLGAMVCGEKKEAFKSAKLAASVELCETVLRAGHGFTTHPTGYY